MCNSLEIIIIILSITIISPSLRIAGAHSTECFWAPGKRLCLDYIYIGLLVLTFFAKSLLIVDLMKYSFLAISQFILVLLEFSTFPVLLLNSDNFKLGFVEKM